MSSNGQQLLQQQQQPNQHGKEGFSYGSNYRIAPGSMCSEITSWTTDPGVEPWQASQSAAESAAAAAAATAAFGEYRPAQEYPSQYKMPFSTAESSEFCGTPSRGSNGGPERELSFAATASPGNTDGGAGTAGFDPGCPEPPSYSHGKGGSMHGGAAGGHEQDGDGFPGEKSGKGSFDSNGLLQYTRVGSSAQSKKGRLFKCCFVQTNSATASPMGSGAGAVDPRSSAHPGASRLGCSNQAQSPRAPFDGPAGQNACAEAVPAHADAGQGFGCPSDCCMADDSFCSAESVAPTHWTGSCPGVDMEASMSMGGPCADRQHFPLQPMPPPPLWASPLFPPPDGYLPVGVEEDEHAQHAHFAQRVRMLRLQAAAAAAAAGGPAGGFGGNCADAGIDMQESEQVAGAGLPAHDMQELYELNSRSVSDMVTDDSQMLTRVYLQQPRELGKGTKAGSSTPQDDTAEQQGRTMLVQMQAKHERKWASTSATDSPKTDRIKAYFKVGESPAWILLRVKLFISDCITCLAATTGFCFSGRTGRLCRPVRGSKTWVFAP